MIAELEAIDFRGREVRHSSFVRLAVLAELCKRGKLNEQLQWIHR